jgi:toxin ParE1/3/4
MRLKWTHAASRDLELIESYIGQDDPIAALDTVLTILHRVESLKEHPGLGRPGRVAGTRELPIPGLPHIVAYMERANEVIILRVLHGSMRRPNHF